MIEAGLTIWDIYEAGTTLMDPCASLGDKVLSGGSMMMSAGGPGPKSLYEGLGKGVKKALGAGKKVPRAATRYADPKFAAQLERQLANDGSSSVFKSLRSLEKRLAEHQAKLSDLQFKSSVEREIRTFQKQIDTLKEFISQKGLSP